MDLHAVLVDVGRRVAELRAARGMTQEELADAAGLDVSTLRKVEHGERNVTMRTIVTVAGALGCETPAPLFESPSTPRARPGRPRRRP